ncbi:MAG: hypothetical protein QF926_10400 [Alphaproteobacteria bacterium]|jgi:hypothetical protein|nr:hypothetical protein [Alphaproteobacteria bacterium]
MNKVSGRDGPQPAATPDRRAAARRHLRDLDGGLNRLWQLGRNLIVGWCPRREGIDLLVIPQYMLPELTGEISGLLSGSHAMARDQLMTVAAMFRVKPISLALPFTPGPKGLGTKAIDSVVRRYSVTKSDYRAALLFDIVSFSLYTPLEQVTLLNSLAYSINVAHRQAIANKLRIDLGRSTTGDGFYVWNRDDGISADVNLFYLMMLILADNALAQIKGNPRTAPVLRTCFHIGSHYEYYQAEGLNPAISGYIVGDLTIELARMIGKALDGQVLFGNFDRPNDETAGRGGGGTPVPTPVFVKRAQDQLDRLADITLSSEEISAIKVYLTGERVERGVYNIKKYSVVDKHGLRRDVFNAKVNIFRGNSDTLYLGLENKELERFDAEEGQYRQTGERAH